VSRSQSRASDAPDWAVEALDRLRESMVAEADALVHADIDRLAQVVQCKEQILRRLAAELSPSDSTALREAFRSLRDLNERNARLLAPRIRMNQVRIEALLGAMGSGALYSANGRAGGTENRPTRRGVSA